MKLINKNTQPNYLFTFNIDDPTTRYDDFRQLINPANNEKYCKWKVQNQSQILEILKWPY